MARNSSLVTQDGAGNVSLRLQPGSRTSVVALTDTHGDVPNYFPEGSVYNFTIIDVPGAVATNNFISVFNPVGNIRQMSLLSLAIESYATTNTGTPNSMAGYRTTAASGGTLIAASSVTKYITLQPDTTAEVRINNPTITLLGTGIPVAPATPPFSGGGGASGTTAFTPASSAALAEILPGEGFVMRTLAGDPAQRWNISLTWLEF